MFDLGDTIPLGVTIRDSSQNPTTPSAIALTITLPDGTTVSPTPATGATGVYTYDYVPAQAGRYVVRWTTTGPATAFTDSFDVDQAAPLMMFSLGEAKEFLDLEDDTNDEELRSFIAGVTAVVEDGNGKDFAGVGPVVRRTVTTTLYPNGCGEVVLPHSQILSFTSAVTLAGTVVDVTGWTYTDGIVRHTSGVGPTFPVTPWSVTYVVGRSVIPPNVLLAAKGILKHAWQTQRATETPVFLVPNWAKEALAPDVEYAGFA